MSKRKPRRPEPDVELVDDDGDDEAPVSEGLVNLGEVLDEFSEQAEAVLLARWNPEKKKRQYVATLPIAQFSFEHVRDTYGGGDYFASLTDKKSRILKTTSFSIDDRFKGGWGGPSAPADGARANGGGDPDGTRIKLAELEGELRGLRGGGQDRALDPISLIEKLTTVMRSLAPPAPAGPPDPLSAIDKIVGVVEKVVGVGREIAPERPATDWGHVVDRGVDAVEKILDESRAQRVPGVPPAPANGAPPALPPGVEALPAWQQEVLGWIPRLLQRAKDGKDPELAADVFLEDVSRGTAVALEAVVQVEGFV